MRSLDLRREPSVRQVEAILRNLDQQLTTRGATVDRAGAVGGLRFRMPRPWKAPRLGILLFITSGRVVVTAGSGGPWRVRYGLDFSMLRAVVIALSVGLIAIGLAWPRANLINALLMLWLVVYGVPHLVASARFRRVIRTSASDIVERRKVPRNSGSQPEVTDPPSEAGPPSDGMEIRPIE